MELNGILKSVFLSSKFRLNWIKFFQHLLLLSVSHPRAEIKRKLDLFCVQKSTTVQQMHDLKIHFGPWIWFCYLVFGKEDRRKDKGREQIEYIRLHVRESNYLSTSLWWEMHEDCHNLRAFPITKDRRVVERGENGSERREERRKEKKGWGNQSRRVKKHVLWPSGPASQFCL